MKLPAWCLHSLLPLLLLLLAATAQRSTPPPLLEEPLGGDDEYDYSGEDLDDEVIDWFSHNVTFDKGMLERDIFHHNELTFIDEEPIALIVPLHFPLRHGRKDTSPLDRIRPIFTHRSHDRHPVPWLTRDPSPSIVFPYCHNYQYFFLSFGHLNTHHRHLQNTLRRIPGINATLWELPLRYWEPEDTALFFLACYDLNPKHDNPYGPAYTYIWSVRPNFDNFHWLRTTVEKDDYTYVSLVVNDALEDMSAYVKPSHWWIPLITLEPERIPDFPIPLHLNTTVITTYSQCDMVSGTIVFSLRPERTPQGRSYPSINTTSHEFNLMLPDIANGTLGAYMTYCYQADRPEGVPSDNRDLYTFVRGPFRDDDFTAFAGSTFVDMGSKAYNHFQLIPHVFAYSYYTPKDPLTLLTRGQNLTLAHVYIPAGLNSWNVSLNTTDGIYFLRRGVNPTHQGPVVLNVTYDGRFLHIFVSNLSESGFGGYGVSVTYWDGAPRSVYSRRVYVSAHIPPWFFLMEAQRPVHVRHDIPKIQDRYLAKPPEPIVVIEPPKNMNPRLSFAQFAAQVSSDSSIITTKSSPEERLLSKPTVISALVIVALCICLAGISLWLWGQYSRLRRRLHEIMSTLAQRQPIYRPTTIPRARLPHDIDLEAALE